MRRNILTLIVLLSLAIPAMAGLSPAEKNAANDIGNNSPGDINNSSASVAIPQIAVNPEQISWTEGLAWIKNGETQNITVTITNSGDQVLTVTEIDAVRITGSAWLAVSETSLSVPAGLPNTAAFDIIVDASALTHGLGNSSWLDGKIFLISDAGNNDSLIIPLHILAADSVVAVKWDTAATSTAWGGLKNSSAVGENVALAISNFGEIGAGGMDGNMQANMDFSKDGGECRTDDRAKLYLWSGSPFILQHDGGGANARLTTSYNQPDQSSPISFDPLPYGPGMSSGISAGGYYGEYDSVFTGAFANRDTTIIMERTFFAPRDNPDNPSFIVCKTVVYSGDGQSHDNVTIGSFTDWDIPSVKSPDNTVGRSAPSSPAGAFIYAQGTDADTSDVNLICQPNINRFGAERFLDWHTNSEYNADDCAANDTTWGSWGSSQLVSDPDGTGLPDAQQWYDSISAKNGIFANDSSFDQAIWVTYLFDQTVGATDTLTFYSLWSTLHDGSFANFEDNLVEARSWSLINIRGSWCATCCTGETMGNFDCTGRIDIGDVTAMIYYLFISLKESCCFDEGDLDRSGLVDIGDLAMLTRSLWITLEPLGPCP